MSKAVTDFLTDIITQPSGIDYWYNRHHGQPTPKLVRMSIDLGYMTFIKQKPRASRSGGSAPWRRSANRKGVIVDCQITQAGIDFLLRTGAIEPRKDGGFQHTQQRNPTYG